MADDIVQVIADTRADAATLQEVVNGDADTQITSRLGESYPSVQKAIKLMTQSGLSFTAFETKSLMTASSLANGSYAIVTNDTTTNNGLHIKKSGSWSKVSYDIDERQKTYTDVVANIALVSAKTYADTTANAALVGAKTYADGVGTAAVSQLKTYTDGKKTDAVNESKFYTDNQSTATLNAAKTDATNKAESVRLSAIASAATDATTKANTALASSKTYSDGVGASVLSQSKTYTDTAQSAAISAAATDATTKADAASEASNKYSSASFIKKNEANTDLLFAFTDSDGNLTDLQVGDDGLITDEVIESWSGRIAPFMEDGFVKKYTADSSGLLSLTDEDGNLTDLQIDSDGQFPDAVLANWRERLDIPDSVEAVETYAPNYDDYLLPDMTNTVLPINQSDYHYKGGEFLPVMPNLDQVVYVGSSSAFRSKDSLALKFQSLNPNVDVFGFTQGGAVIEHINMLIGDQPMSLTFENNTINGTGDSNVTYTLGTMAGFLDNNILTGWVSGVYGRLMHHETEAGKYIFRRLEAGTDVILTGAEPIIPENGHKYRNALQILWIGKNNMQSGFPGSSADPVATLIDNTRSIIDFSASLIKRTIVMTHYINKDTPAISDERTRITRVNHLYKLHFKDAVFDVNPILTGAQIFTDLGITRTATDIQQQALGNVPPSLHADSAHLTTAASDYLLDKLIAFIATKNWF